MFFKNSNVIVLIQNDYPNTLVLKQCINDVQRRLFCVKPEKKVCVKVNALNLCNILPKAHNSVKN